ncbi:carbonate dehydratase [Xylanibacillus composti]|uniref:Carbonate dehydratase n=1 Tax=Xylanibacillus composti TaxID=1572762 RepID=A0A8J4M0A3_9BACL|nr:carbonate dehydratase [Xylanibacillus composti]MDT9725556.1 carbonate dehydratase [Xylanibacillus composti]GIQ67650.1 hypothetical protein XYCOK13_04740 [Xylanibacillus composti]
MGSYPAGPWNASVHFIGPNPVTTFNQIPIAPSIEQGVYVGPFSSVIGDVVIKKNTFIAPNVSIRADEGTPFHIGEGSNLQDGVILHGLKDARVELPDRAYSIYLGHAVTVAHGALVHGPVYIGHHTFVGFQALVFQAITGHNVYISNHAIVTGNVRIANHRFVPPGAVIDSQDKADRLKPVPKNKEEFAQEVLRVNREFAASYPLMFGKNRCSCGLACNL